MTGIRFEIEVDGEQQLDRALSRFGDRLRNIQPFFEIAADMVAGFVRAQFESEGGRTGGWAALSPRYAAYKLAKVGPQPILVFTGRMRQSLIERTGDNIREIGTDSMKWGTSTPYAIFHQRGTSKMPQRKIIDLTEDDKMALMKTLQRFIAGDPAEFGL